MKYIPPFSQNFDCAANKMWFSSCNNFEHKNRHTYFLSAYVPMQTFKYLIIQSRFLHHFIHHFCVVLYHFTISYDTLTKSTIHATRLRILYLQGFLTFCKFKNKEFDKFLLILLHFILKPPIFKAFRLYLFLLKHSAAHLLHIFFSDSSLYTLFHQTHRIKPNKRFTHLFSFLHTVYRKGF